MPARLLRTAVALGSNLGDRDAHLRYAVARLRSILTDPTASEFMDTAPCGVATVGQPRFLNAVVVGWSAAGPADLLALLQGIEDARGRRRPFRHAPRTLDLDIILMGGLIVSTPALEVPHPRFRERRFVLAPLAEVAPDLMDPVSGMSVRGLLARLDSSDACEPLLLEPQRLDRVETRRLAGRVEAEEDSRGRREHDSGRDGVGGDRRRPLQEARQCGREAVSETDPDQTAD